MAPARAADRSRPPIVRSAISSSRRDGHRRGHPRRLMPTRERQRAITPLCWADARPPTVRRRRLAALAVAVVLAAAAGLHRRRRLRADERRPVEHDDDDRAACGPTTACSRSACCCPLSGEGATIGQGMVEAAARAVDEINAAGGVLGSRSWLVTADEGADASSAADGIERPRRRGCRRRRRTGVVDGRPGDARRPLSARACSRARPPPRRSPSTTIPSSQLFFRTAPSDSLQADAIAKLAQQTGTFTAAVAFLDDAYGRPLAEATVAALDGSRPRRRPPRSPSPAPTRASSTRPPSSSTARPSWWS